MKTIRVSHSLDPDQDRCSVGPDLGPYQLQRLSAVDKICLWQGRVNSASWVIFTRFFLSSADLGPICLKKLSADGTRR